MAANAGIFYFETISEAHEKKTVESFEIKRLKKDFIIESLY